MSDELRVVAYESVSRRRLRDRLRFAFKLIFRPRHLGDFDFQIGPKAEADLRAILAERDKVR